jgi:deoxyribodipyrimidine photolyase
VRYVQRGAGINALQELSDFVEHHAASADRSLADVSGHQSARTSMHLATGSLSPRQIYWLAIDKPGCEWLMSHMEMRDYFIYSAADNMESFVRWATGERKLPLVDAGMKELAQMGYCSNRVRQNLASVLTNDLKTD